MQQIKSHLRCLLPLHYKLKKWVAVNLMDYRRELQASHGK